MICPDCDGDGFWVMITGTEYLNGDGGPYAPIEERTPCPYCGGTGICDYGDDWEHEEEEAENERMEAA